MPMKLSNEEIAAGLINRLRDMLGHTPQLEQVDFVSCENNGRDTMAYAYFNGDECCCLCFPTPPLFDACEVECLMLRGHDHVVVH